MCFLACLSGVCKLGQHRCYLLFSVKRRRRGYSAASRVLSAIPAMIKLKMTAANSSNHPQ
jgi:hypothetical protein